MPAVHADHLPLADFVRLAFMNLLAFAADL